ncbi:indole-3-glycerol phosphate synthase TrpC [Exiguobacterium flavidum]|uniref:indole-3-glycerol phosphate synthase TrpC n=1 Tax=Exiguobacterium flavidum TaxID=2184695 RepID=UPI000DF754FD|nr:indole-3-glycerol phosphate synthase TrpC [Exiguobacterium flavidum]
MNTLERIIETKRDEVERLKMDLQESPGVRKTKQTIHDALGEQELSVIAEIKRASPSKGAIKLDIDPVEQAKRYEEGGATVISVLTDETYFKGSMKDLRAVSEAVDIPVLCKDFIIDRVQIDLARRNGASMILLIVAVLDDKALRELFDYATVSGLEVLVEVHDEAELRRAESAGARIIGINNRDLKRFSIDLATSERLLKQRKPGIRYVSESGIKEVEVAFRLKEAGADAILIGETLMRASDPGTFIRAVRGHS